MRPLDELRIKNFADGKDLRDYSLETVRMFRTDAVKAGYTLGVRSSTPV